MTRISQEHDSLRCPCRYAVAVLIYALLPAGLWSSIGWAQEPTPQEAQEPTPQEPKPLAVQTEPKKLPRAPTAKPPSSPKPMPVVRSGSDTMSGGVLATELASCDKASERSEHLRLPGAKGEIKLDRCYRGRDHLACSFHSLMREAKALFDEYGKIIEADYPNLGNVAAMCSIQPENLAADLRNASAFDARFKILKNEYALRANCASKFEQSLRDVNLPDMVRGPEILKSLVDSMQADIKGAVTVQKQVLELAEKIDASQKAMVTIRKIHPSICMRDQSVRPAADERGSPGQRPSETN
jgi:hypothetical protein